MAFEFRLPDIGEGVIEGEIVRWLVKEGDQIREDQPMVEVMTDKATVEIPAPKAGRVAKIAAPEGKTCAVGAVMVVIDEEGGSSSAKGNGHVPTLAAEERELEQNLPRTTTQVPSASTGGNGGKALATPATRKLARDMGVDLASVSATGPGGRVTRTDVLAAAGHRAAQVAKPPISVELRSGDERAPQVGLVVPVPVQADASDEHVPFRGVRKKIAENMARSKRTAAHFTYVEEADVTELVAVRDRARKRAEERGVKLTFIPFIVKAVVSGLKKYPIVNATLDEEKGEIVLRKRYHIGVAAASAEGLLVPVVRDADRKSLFDIARELQEVSERAKHGKASRDELTGSTFTISSLGALGGVLATPIINHPEVAVLGVHKIKKTPVWQDGQFVPRDVMNFSISLDHRVVDGYEGALFLQHVISLLADPTSLFMDMV